MPRISVWRSRHPSGRLLPTDTAPATLQRSCSSVTEDVILRAENIKKYFPIRRGIVFKRIVGQTKAVDGVTFDLHRGETLGLVGESGCGKSTLSRTLLRLLEPSGGSAFYEGRDIFAMGASELRKLRRDVQIIFQDPYASLNPRMTVGNIIGEAYDIHRGSVSGKQERRRRVRELLDRVGLRAEYENRYPHQFSGGQRQRIGIARALALRPSVIIADEPVSALDVSVQAQVLNLLEDIQDEFNLSYVFIAHDLSVVRHISDRVAVMYLGRIVEIGDEDQIYGHALHPYTQALLSAVPVPDPQTRGKRHTILLEGDVPSPANPPSGCHFRTRCWKAGEICEVEYPDLTDENGQRTHPAACHFAAEREDVSL
ncbi:MAG: dipeptide ABC transporter ATP-binding protein [Acidimicrobiia bacterium]|nr:dipeptide ABC transporter ATP-binding protein [Acidimicrobiia bacterium]